MDCFIFQWFIIHYCIWIFWWSSRPRFGQWDYLQPCFRVLVTLWHATIVLFKILFNCHFNFCRICNDVPSLIPDVGNLYFLSFYMVSLARGLSILFCFSKNNFWFLYSFFCLQFHWFLPAIISFLLLLLGLVCSSFLVVKVQG